MATFPVDLIDERTQELIKGAKEILVGQQSGFVFSFAPPPLADKFKWPRRFPLREEDELKDKLRSVLSEFEKKYPDRQRHSVSNELVANIREVIGDQVGKFPLGKSKSGNVAINISANSDDLEKDLSLNSDSFKRSLATALKLVTNRKVHSNHEIKVVNDELEVVEDKQESEVDSIWDAIQNACRR